MIFNKDSTLSFLGNQKRKLGNVLPATRAGEVTTWEQTMLITPSVTVTQLTSLTTAVTANGTKGVITTFNATTAALGASTFTVNNTSMGSATAHVEGYICDYAGTVLTNGVPSVFVKNRTATSFDVVIVNTHATNALSGVLNIGFEIKA